jgi:oligoendopeptidase F
MEENNSNDLDFSKIPPYQPRRFVPDNVDLSNVGQVVMLYNKLYERDITSAEQLESFLLDRSELDAVLGQHEAVLYIRMTCQTDDPARAQAYKKFVETILPAVKPLMDKLNRKYLEDSKRFSLNKKRPSAPLGTVSLSNRYEVYDRDTKADVKLFREENVPLQTQEELLSQEYQTICGAMTVNFQGKEYTMAQMRKFYEQTDRSVRESAWRAAAQRRLQDAQRLDETLDKMLILRQQIAANAGFDNYRDYKFRQYHRFDYTPDDCKRFHDAVEKLVVPVMAKIYERRKSQMNLSSLRPWDLNVDPQGREPLKPFETIDEYTAGAKQIFQRIDPEFGEQFQEMIDMGLFDLASRKGKAPGGYQESLREARKAFIFGNAIGTDSDLELIFHEGGHAFHSQACAHDSLLAYRHAPIEFAEVASMSMELLAKEHLSVFYNEQDAKRSCRTHLEWVVYLLARVALVDSFQHWIYENPGHDVSERAEQWVKLHQHCDGQFEDWSGLEKERRYQWHRILHIFQFPFYMIEYGIAQLGALGLWMQYKNDKAAAISNYRKALALGGSRPLPELFATAGLEFDFSEKTIAPLIDAIGEELTQSE